MGVVESIAPKIGCVPQTLLDWVKRHEVDTGTRDGVSTDERERVEALERMLVSVTRRRALVDPRSVQLARWSVKQEPVIGSCSDERVLNFVCEA